jgi:acetyltransferase EpsM
MDTSPLIIYGSGGHGKVVLEAALLTELNPYCMIDDQPLESNIFGVPVLSASDKQWIGLAKFRFIVAIGDNRIRSKIFFQLRERGGIPQTVIHPAAVISKTIQIGDGTAVLANVVINHGAIIGENVILNTACSVDHDCRIEDNVHLCPGVRLAGCVTIGNSSMVGIGTSVIPNVKIGPSVVIGAGSVVVRNLPEGVQAFGNPARVRRHLLVEYLR